MTEALCILAAGDEAEAVAGARRAGALAGGAVRDRRASAQRRARSPGASRGVGGDDPRATPRPSRPAPSARSASTTTTISRRATCSRRSSRPSSALARELRAAGHHPHPGGDRRHVRHPEGERAAIRGRLPLLHRGHGDGAAGPGHRVLPVVRRDRDVSEGRRACARRRRSSRPTGCSIETDSPYLAPVPYRGKRNEPAYVGRVLDVARRGARRSGGGPRGAGHRNFVRLFGPTRVEATA